MIEYAASAVALALVLWAPGYALVRLRGRRLGPLRRSAEIVLGVACWLALVFALCSLQWWHGTALTLAAAASLLAALAARLLVKSDPAEEDASAQTPPPTLFEMFLLSALAFVCAAVGLAAMGPSVSWDAASYHLTIPKLYLEAEGFRALPMNVYSNWPLAIELLFSIALLAKGYVLAKLVHFGFGLLTLWAVLGICRDARRGTGALAVALLLISPVVQFELTKAYVDLAQAFLLLSALRFMLRAKQGDAHANHALLLSGICCGVLAGTKLTGLISAAAVGVLYLPELWRATRSGVAARTFGPFALRFALPALLLTVPWALKSYAFTGNPIFPFFYDALGGTDWSPRLAEQFSGWQASIGMGREPLDYLLLPYRLIVHPDHFGDALGYHWLGLVPLALALGWSSRPARCCLAAAGVHFAVWTVSAQDSRYLVPILPLLAVASAISVAGIVDRLAERARGLWPGVLAVATGAVLWFGAGPLIQGVQYAALFQARGAELAESAVDPVYAFIERELPEDARLLMLHTNQGFFCERDYLSDSFFQASQISDWLRDAGDQHGVLERLRDRSITHVLRFRHEWNHLYPENLRALMRDPALVERVYGSNYSRFEIVSLR